MTGERLVRDAAYLKSCTARGVAMPERGSALDRTVFAPRGGGRVHRLRIPGIDRQPGGGPHVCCRAEIGPVIVLRLRRERNSEGSRNPRVEMGFARAESASEWAVGLAQPRGPRAVPSHREPGPW